VVVVVNKMENIEKRFGEIKESLEALPNKN